MAKSSSVDLQSLASYGGVVLLQVEDAEMATSSPVRDAAIAAHRYKLAVAAFAKTKREIELNTRFSAEGRKAELGDYCVRTLNELGRADSILEKARAELDELQAEARKVPLAALTPAQLALVPAVYAHLAAMDPLLLPGVLTSAAEARDVVTLQAFLAGPTAKELRLGVSDQQLDQAREVCAGPLPGDKRKALARMRELIDGATSLRKDLVRDLKRAAGLEQDPLMAMLGVEQGQPVDDPIARQAMGLDVNRTADPKGDEPAQAA